MFLFQHSEAYSQTYARHLVRAGLSFVAYSFASFFIAVSFFSTSTYAQQASHPFTAAQIADDGVNGVVQAHNPNCWFETSLAAMAMVPRGQRMISDMISQTAPSAYQVTFPGQHESINVNQSDLRNFQLRDPAPWATILEIACLKKFPNNDGAYGTQTRQPAIQTGIELLTGVRATVIRPDQCSLQEISAAIERATNEKIPMAMSTKNPRETGLSNQPISPNHAYALIDYDRGSGKVTVRNPHGREPGFAPGQLASVGIEHPGAGLVSMPLQTFQTYFRYMAWPSSF